MKKIKKNLSNWLSSAILFSINKKSSAVSSLSSLDNIFLNNNCTSSFSLLHFVFLFCRYGKIISTKAILDENTKKCKGEVILLAIWSDISSHCRYGQIISTKAILDLSTSKCKGEIPIPPSFARLFCLMLFFYSRTIKSVYLQTEMVAVFKIIFYIRIVNSASHQCYKHCRDTDWFLQLIYSIL